MCVIKTVNTETLKLLNSFEIKFANCANCTRLQITLFINLNLFAIQQMVQVATYVI